MRRPGKDYGAWPSAGQRAAGQRVTRRARGQRAEGACAMQGSVRRPRTNSRRGAEWVHAPALGGQFWQFHGYRGAASQGRQRQCRGYGVRDTHKQARTRPRLGRLFLCLSVSLPPPPLSLSDFFFSLSFARARSLPPPLPPSLPPSFPSPLSPFPSVSLFSSRYLCRCLGFSLSLSLLNFSLFQDGTTPLHRACFLARKEVAMALIEKGAHVNVKDKVRETSARTIRLRTCLGRDSQKTRKKRCWSFAAQV